MNTTSDPHFGRLMVGVVLAMTALAGCTSSEGDDDGSEVANTDPVRAVAEDSQTEFRTPCEIIWGKISNADLAGNRPREAELMELARAYECTMRPESVSLREYPALEDVPDPVPPEYSVSSYQTGYDMCRDSAGIYDEAGTRDPQQAARWYSTLSVSDRALVEGGYRGCLRALSGQPTEHPR